MANFQPGEVVALASARDEQNDTHLAAQVWTEAGRPVMGRLFVDGGENGDEGRVRFSPDPTLVVDWTRSPGPGAQAQ